MDTQTPSITRTPFQAKMPPDELNLWFCPACGNLITGSYNIDPARKRCSKTWHLDIAQKRAYVAVDAPPRTPAAESQPFPVDPGSSGGVGS